MVILPLSFGLEYLLFYSDVAGMFPILFFLF